MLDVLIVQHYWIKLINVLHMPNCFLILHVFTIMEVHLSQAQIGPCLKCNHVYTKYCNHIAQRLNVPLNAFEIIVE